MAFALINQELQFEPHSLSVTPKPKPHREKDGLERRLEVKELQQGVGGNCPDERSDENSRRGKWEQGQSQGRVHSPGARRRERSTVYSLETMEGMGQDGVHRLPGDSCQCGEQMAGSQESGEWKSESD